MHCIKQIYVNDELVDSILNQDREFNTTLIIPFSKIGSETNAFKGEIDEVKVYYGSETPTYKNMLEQIINKAQILDETMYDSILLNAMKDILNKAVEIKNNADSTQDEIKSVMLELANAIDNLILDGSFTKQDLEKLIKYTQALDETKYEANIWNTIKSSLTKAIEVQNNENASQADITSVMSDLRKAINSLVKFEGKEELDKVITEAEKLDKEKYEANTWKQLEEALTKAKTVKNNEKSTQSEITEAERLNKEKYETDAWKQLEEALTKAKTVKNNEKSTQNEITEAITNLRKAISNLKHYVDNNNSSSNSNKGSNGGSSSKAAISGGTKNNNNETTSANSSVVKPIVTVTDNVANVSLSENDTEKVINEAINNKSNNIIIQPDIKEDISKINVSIPNKSISEIKDKTDSNITIKSSVADITIPNKVMGELAGNKKDDLFISAERKDNNEIDIQIKVGNNIVKNLKNTIKVSIPVSNNSYEMVPKIVNLDGTKTIISKSVLANNQLSIVLNGTATINIVDNSKNFNDIESHWAKNSIGFVTSRDLFQGTSENEFSPKKTMTRGMIVTVLHRLENTPKAGKTSAFSDVSNNDYYSEAVNWANENKIVTGTGEGFSPTQDVTREQLAVILYNYAKVTGVNINNKKDIESFLDSSNVSSWANEAMQYAVGSVLISGKSGKKLVPKASATRAEVSAIITRFVQNAVKER